MFLKKQPRHRKTAAEVAAEVEQIRNGILSGKSLAEIRFEIGLSRAHFKSRMAKVLATMLINGDAFPKVKSEICSANRRLKDLLQIFPQSTDVSQIPEEFFCRIEPLDDTFGWRIIPQF